MMAPCVSGQLLRAGIVTTVPVCRRRALAPCDGAPTTRPSGNSSEPPPERQLLLARLPTQLEEAGHATAGRGGRQRAASSRRPSSVGSSAPFTARLASGGAPAGEGRDRCG